MPAMTFQRRQRRKRLMTAVFAVLSVIYLLPVLLVLINAFKSNAYINTETFRLPTADSFVGFKKKIVTFNAQSDTLRVIMEEDIQALDEAVVVAYGTTTRREMTGAISTVKGEDLEGIPSPNIATLLQGRVAGMDITNISGAPGGGGAAITIRGYNSLDIELERRFSNPLWVVDGVPLNAFTSPITGTNLLADLNPDMIESIQVLKDASSAGNLWLTCSKRSNYCYHEKRIERSRCYIFRQFFPIMEHSTPLSRSNLRTS